MSKTILVVEDEWLIAMDLTAMLERMGWTVVGPASTVAAALGLLEKGLPTAAVLDFNLGHEIVTPVAEVLKAADIPFVLASAYTTSGVLKHNAFVGVTNIGKPVQEDALLAAVDAFHLG